VIYVPCKYDNDFVVVGSGSAAQGIGRNPGHGIRIGRAGHAREPAAVDKVVNDNGVLSPLATHGEAKQSLELRKAMDWWSRADDTAPRTQVHNLPSQVNPREPYPVPVLSIARTSTQ
jgi:hypothetical protein